MKFTNESFVEKAKSIHGEKYDYAKVEYKNAHTPVEVLCPIHGSFLQRPHAHLNMKQGCPTCGLKNRKNNNKTTEDFLKECNNKWGNKYDYSNTTYTSKVVKINYLCALHGVVEQFPARHLKCGCPFCNGRGVSRHDSASFIEMANKIHNNKYDYSKLSFTKMNDKVTIICPIHGEFVQRASNHVHLKNGCPACAVSTTKNN